MYFKHCSIISDATITVIYNKKLYYRCTQQADVLPSKNQVLCLLTKNTVNKPPLL